MEYLFSPQKNIVFQARNFFGTITIRQKREDVPPPEETAGSNGQPVKEGKPYALDLLNGTTVHGSQFARAERRGQPTSYYATTSGIGRVLNFFHNNRPPGGVRIGDVGLGTGTLAAYAMKGDYLTFYEINPVVIDMATSGEWFTYIADCRRAAPSAILNSETPASRSKAKLRYPNCRATTSWCSTPSAATQFPPISSRSKPAKTICRASRRPAVDGAEGALVIHVSNRYLDLSRVVRKIAEELGFTCLDIRSPGNSDQLINSADWMVLTRNEALIAALKPFDFKPDPEAPLKPPVLWTDARSSLFEILKK